MPRKYSEEEFAQKFWEKVDKTSDPQGCWLWTGCINRGYGRINKNYTGNTLAYRVAYLLSGKIIPEGLVLAHSELCKGKKHCCNPAHLTPKTTLENNGHDRWRDGTMTFAKLTADQVIAIRERKNEDQRSLATEFDTSQQTISRIILNQSYKHI